jgi:hypothetical protein
MKLVAATLQLDDNRPACLVDSEEVDPVIDKLRGTQLLSDEKEPFAKLPKEGFGRCPNHLLKVGPFANADFGE